MLMNFGMKGKNMPRQRKKANRTKTVPAKTISAREWCLQEFGGIAKNWKDATCQAKFEDPHS